MSFQRIDLEDTSRNDEKISIMVYGYNEAEINMLKKYCDAQGVDHLIAVENGMLEMTLEDILKGEKAIKPSSLIEGRAVIMNGFSGSELQSFLKNFKNTGLERPIFATVTPISKTWTFKALINELLKEHEMMKNRTKNS